MPIPRIAASSYSNTAPLIWSFLYGAQHGKVELLLDDAPARSAALLAQNRVDAALVPVIAYQEIEDLVLIPDVCVGARERAKSVLLITKGKELADVKSLALDVSSKTSVALTKIIFKEFLGFEPMWKNAEPNLEKMLDENDCALLIGDPALAIAENQGRNATVMERVTFETNNTLVSTRVSAEYCTFDLVELWKKFTGFGFVFAMWMAQKKSAEKLRDVNFAGARDEGLAHIDAIINNYSDEIPLKAEEFRAYLTENITFSIDDSLQNGMGLFFKLAKKNDLLRNLKSMKFREEEKLPQM